MNTTATPAKGKSLQSLALGRIDILKLDPRIIREVPGWNVRAASPELEEHIEALAASIQEIGVQEPLTVVNKDGVPNLTNGHCRLEAVMRLIKRGVDIPWVPCRPESQYSNDAEHVLSMLTRNAGKPLSTLETAEVLKRLHNYGWDAGTIAAKSGMTRATVERLLDLTSAPEEVKQLITGGKVSATLAQEAIKAHGPEAAPAVLKKAVKAAETAGKAAETAGKAKATKKHLGGPNWNKLGPEMKALLDKVNAGPRDPNDWEDAVAEFLQKNF